MFPDKLLSFLEFRVYQVEKKHNVTPRVGDVAVTYKLLLSLVLAACSCRGGIASVGSFFLTFCSFWVEVT